MQFVTHKNRINNIFASYYSQICIYRRTTWADFEISLRQGKAFSMSNRKEKIAKYKGGFPHVHYPP